MKRKKLLTLISTSVIATALSASVFAGGPTTESMSPNDSGFLLGMNYGTQLQNNPALMVGYVNSMFLADISANYTQFDVGTRSTNIYETRAELGLRRALTDTLYLTYGAMGAYGFKGSSVVTGTVNPYAIGAFAGLDYQPLSHFFNLI